MNTRSVRTQGPIVSSRRSRFLPEVPNPVGTTAAIFADPSYSAERARCLPVHDINSVERIGNHDQHLIPAAWDHAFFFSFIRVVINLRTRAIGSGLSVGKCNELLVCE